MNSKKIMILVLMVSFLVGMTGQVFANEIKSPFDLVSNITEGFVDNLVDTLSKSAEYFKQVVARFADMGNHWADGVVGKLVEIGAIGGYEDGSFRPNNPITRAEFSRILNASLGLKTVKTEAFNDTVNHWSKDNINALAHYGIIDKSEYGANYQPNQNITRIEIAKMIVRSAGLNEEAKAKIGQSTGFGDNSSIKTSDSGYVIIAKENKLIGGYQDNTFKPNNNATRAEASAMIIRTLEMMTKTNKTPPQETPIKKESSIPTPIFGGDWGQFRSYWHLHIVNVEDFEIGVYSFKTNFISHPDYNSYVTKDMFSGKVSTRDRTNWLNFDSENQLRNQAGVVRLNSLVGFEHREIRERVDVDIKNGEKVVFEVIIRNNETGETKTFQPEFVWQN